METSCIFNAYLGQFQWVSTINYKGVVCTREWSSVKPTRKQIRKYMKRLRNKFK